MTSGCSRNALRMQRQSDAMGHRIVIVRWTGRHATALKLALRMSSEAFAERLGAGLRAVAEWSREPDMVPTTVMQHALDTLLSQSDDDAQTRFELLVNGRSSRAGATPDTVATDLTTDGLLDWVDLRAGWQAGTARLQLHDQLAQMTPLLARQKAAQRTQVARSSVAASINAIYRSPRGNTTCTSAGAEQRPPRPVSSPAPSGPS